MKNKKLQAGYTLIELLAVMIILMAVGTIITSILVITLRSGNKSTTTNDIRQNGNYAMAQMSKMIAYAYSFDGLSADGQQTWYDNCVIPYVGSNTPIPSLPSKYYSVKITSSDQLQTDFDCSNTILSSQSAGLTSPLVNSDTDATCWFTCSQSSLTSAPTIGIDLTLKKRTTGLPFLPEAQTAIHFQTSVTVRNNNLQP
jgi:type II secretory pathway pseudopilin PulG